VQWPIDILQIPLLQDIIVAIIMFLLGIMAKGVYGHYSLTRPFNKVWRIKDEKTNQVYVVTGSIPHDTYKHLMACGDIDAYVEIVAGLRRHLRKSEIRSFFSPEFPRKFMNENIVTVGGPRWNKITENLIKKSGIPIGYSLENSCFVDAKTGNKFHSNIDRGNGTDYGLIANFPNPYQNGKMVMLLMGGHTYGVLASIQYISPLRETGRKNLKELSKRIKNEDAFCVLLRVEVLDGSPTGANEEVFHRIERDK